MNTKHVKFLKPSIWCHLVLCRPLSQCNMHPMPQSCQCCSADWGFALWWMLVWFSTETIHRKHKAWHRRVLCHYKGSIIMNVFGRHEGKKPTNWPAMAESLWIQVSLVSFTLCNCMLNGNGGVLCSCYSYKVFSPGSIFHQLSLVMWCW